MTYQPTLLERVRILEQKVDRLVNDVAELDNKVAETTNPKNHSQTNSRYGKGKI